MTLKTFKKPYKINLPAFEGPLDLLLYLIQKQELDIYDIPIAKITDQYLEYIGLMESLDLEIAGEFLVMTATLMEIKSMMLLPPEETPEGEEIDPRAELVNRLLEYQRFKEAALQLEQLESIRRDLVGRAPTQLESFEEGKEQQLEWWDLSLYDLMKAMRNVLEGMTARSAEAPYQEVFEERVTVEGKIQFILELLRKTPVLYLSRLFDGSRSRMGKIAVVLASLELARASEVRLNQMELFGEVEIVKTAS